MISDKILYNKARERLETAQFAHKKGYYYSCSSNLYFALFNYMQSILGKGHADKWKHVGIFKAFSKLCMERKLFPEKSLRSLGKTYTALYELRRQADYENHAYESYTIERLKFLYESVAETLHHVNKS
ncbi:HEPN domain-containing protein [Desulfobacterales bacterium HSG2]|nr:HEPN domain-containing protein [Desulfobacterales bacterium HSG2]